MTTDIRIAEPSDAAALARLGAETFEETFGAMYPPADLEGYLAQAYSAETVEAGITSPDQRWFVAERDGRMVGYAQAGPCGLPHPEASPEHGELKRIYVRGSEQGSGVGHALLAQVLEWLEARFEGPLWIGVWSENLGAQRLYRRHGFEKAGEYEFVVGDSRDHEFILKRER